MTETDIDKIVREAATPECEWTESRLTENIIKSHKKRKDMIIDEVSVEVPYNNYGDRGYVDIFIEYIDDIETSHLIEVKSVHAMQNATGANEICRQFQSMKNNFVAGTDYEGPEPFCILAFAPDYRCIKHIKNNYQIYKSVTKEKSGLKIVATQDDWPFIPILENGELSYAVNHFAEKIAEKYPETKSDLHLPIESLHVWLMENYSNNQDKRD